ncbi:MAG TPA: hypothetical protein VGS79_00090, partial [Puia sp.]|nr:hypothetical protein [Puia sp.]
RPFVQRGALFLGAPFIYLMGKSDSSLVVYAALAMFGLFRGIYDSNLFSALYDVIETPFRSAATGIMLMFAFVVGSLSPYILGALEPRFGFSNGLALLSLVYVFSSICILIAILLFYTRDFTSRANAEKQTLNFS